MALVLTVGHSTHPIAAFIALLTDNAVDPVVDVRTVRGSRRNPQFNAATLAPALAEAGIGYLAMPALGGLRHRRRDAPPSANPLWHQPSFRNYADYALTAGEFRTALAELAALAHTRRPAIMCAEAVWWRCHRRIITDWLLARGIPVAHILGQGHIEPATITPGARVHPDGSVTYPAPSPASETAFG